MKKMRCYIGILFLSVLLIAAVYAKMEGHRKKAVVSTLQQEAEFCIEDKLHAGIIQNFDKKILQADFFPKGLKIKYLTKEEQAENTYSFFQGPMAYSEGYAWGGEWCNQVVNGNKFGAFGCGMCCMANIYSTLSPYECSPWDIFLYATQVSTYYPSAESGAIGWEDMEQTMKAVGLDCSLYRKPKTYQKFQEKIKESKSAIVLISSRNDAAFWKDTGGHYVTISLYQPKTDEVFLAEPGDLEKNRVWIPLRYVYDALKTVSDYQYLTVKKYEEADNLWKHNGIDEVWNGK